MGLDYVDIFYSHRVDAETPLEETMGALATLHHQGKALYVGISSYSAERTRQAAEILKSHRVPLLIHQPSYSLLNRWIEKDLLQTLGDLGVGCIAFSPLAQGMLSKKYLAGIPADSRAAKAGSFNPDLISKDNIQRIKALNVIAERRGQTLAQMAIAWVLRDPRVTSALVGARTVAQLADTLTSLQKTAFSAEELHEIDCHATDGGLNIWSVSSSIEGTQAA
jgi:L-glyceraldehyde 3-phosphate reductase